MTLNGEMAFILRYPTEFGSHVKLCLGQRLSGLGLCLDVYGLVKLALKAHIRLPISD